MRWDCTPQSSWRFECLLEIALRSRGSRMKQPGTVATVAICLTFCMLSATSCQPTPRQQLSITVTTKALSGTGGTVFVKGQGFTVGPYHINYVNIPNRPGVVQGGAAFPPVQPDGTFTYAEDFNCTSNDSADANTSVLVTAVDDTTQNFANQNIKASPVWVCSQQ
jgi:hypothetical protein